MITVPEFDIREILVTDERKTICRALRQADGRAVVLKVVTGEFSDTTTAAKLRREYELASQLDFPGVARLLGIIEYSGGTAIIMEDFGGVALSKQVENGPLLPAHFLPIARQVATVLADLHRRGVIHKDIKPDNLLLSPDSGEVQLIDFGIAVPISQETVGIVHHRELEGSLPYLSPEQTGRMNRTVDYRTDFYSLGVTFYELLTGRLPFVAADPAELLHAHLARQPQPPAELNPGIPAALQAIVLKLLEKSPEQRYQSAAGLKADLERCLHMLETNGRIETFALATEDRSDRFQIPQILYGREAEIDLLLDSFDETARGMAQWLLVSGYSGIGKSSLIREIHRPIVSQRGYFTAGKFDQFNRNVPYSAVIAAFRDLMRQLLSESEERLARWKSDLLAALGSNGRVIIDVIPEVQLIVGEQPEIPPLPPSEAQNRFNLVFLKFVQVLAGAEHPLVLFLDDLQWADTPSLKLIELLLTDRETAHLLLIGAYRDNEVDATHPLMKSLAGLRETGIEIREIVLKPLGADDLNQMAADTLHCSTAEARPLSTLLLEKTGGNPFFVNEFLKSLHADGLVVFDHSDNRWVWDIEQIRKRNITDNVVDLMRGKIGLLDPDTRQLCQYAACIGNRFDLFTLATVGERSPQAAAKALWPAIREGLIVPVDHTYRLAELFTEAEKMPDIEYRFLHDQVQNAAYVLLDEGSRNALHLRIGRLLRESLSETDQNERIFELVTHFNHGAALLDTEAERTAVAVLNLRAGQKAKNAAAYEPAFRYLSTAVSLLPGDAWQSRYDLALEMHNECAEAAYLSGEVAEMERLTGIVFNRAVQLLHKVKAYSVKIQGYLSLTRNEEALNTCLEIMQMLGARFPANPNKLHIVKSLVTTKLRLRGKSADFLAGLPEMSAAVPVALMEILPYAAAAAYFAKPDLFPLIVFKQVDLSVRHGNHPQSAFAYGTYGLVMCGSTLEFDEGLKFGDLSIRLLEKFRATAAYARVYFLYYGFIRHWRFHFRDCFDGLMEGYRKGLETGDFTYGSYCVFNYGSDRFYTGTPLPALQQELNEYAGALRKIKQNTASVWLNIPRQTVANLLDGQNSSPKLLGPIYDENIEKEKHLAGKDYSGLCVYYMSRMMLGYLFDDIDDAVENGEACVKLLDTVLATPHVLVVHFYYALSLLRMAEKENGKKASLLRRAGKSLDLIRKFAKNGPANNLSKKHLVEAEWKRVKGQPADAMQSFEQSIAAAREYGFLNDEALANELFARFWQERHAPEQSRKYLLESRRLYQKWGAVAKVNWLDRQYSLKTPAIPATEGTSTRSGGHSSDELDMLSLTKAALAISGELNLGKLMSKLMHVVVENAGAQNGYLVIERDAQWRIEAGGDTEELLSIPLAGNDLVPESVVQYVVRTRENLVIDDLLQDVRFADDMVVRKKQTHSALCLPVINQGRIIGILYAENNLNTGVFTADRVQFIQLLSGQVAVSLENALQYERLEQKIRERTAEVVRQKEALEKSLSDLKMAQAKLVESEKMASLGQLTAGIAHEINNPINFVSVGVKNLMRNFEEAKEVFNAYLNPETDPQEALQKLTSEKLRKQILEVFDDSDTLFKSIQNGVERTTSIVRSLRNFSRLDEGTLKEVDLHEGLNSTLEILQSQFKKKAEIIKNYGRLPLVECAAGKINQVFMNILNNALQAIESQGAITVETRHHPETAMVEISISDTGSGMTEEVKRRLFEPFFTTKPVGEGTGLGLSISYSIVEEHGGRIEVESEAGKGSTFRIFLPVQQN